MKEEILKVATNKKAYHDYFVLETYEAGIELKGTEVKSLRQGKANLKDSWCSVVEGELFANGMTTETALIPTRAGCASC